MVGSSDEKVSLGIRKDTASALCYGLGFLPYLGWITGLMFLFFEKNKDVKFHAMQSIAFFGGLAVVHVVAGLVVIFGRLWSLIYIGQFIVWLMLIYRTYNGEKWVLPYVGKWTEKQMAKVK